LKSFRAALVAMPHQSPTFTSAPGNLDIDVVIVITASIGTIGSREPFAVTVSPYLGLRSRFKSSFREDMRLITGTPQASGVCLRYSDPE